MCWQRNTEWKQFSIVSKDDLVKLGINAQDNSIGLIISHSCDIANTNLQAEPTLELLIGTITNKKCDGSFSNGKNNRTLHVQLETAPLVCLEVKMTAKIAIEKTQIAELALIPAPNYEINETIYLKRKCFFNSSMTFVALFIGLLCCVKSFVVLIYV